MELVFRLGLCVMSLLEQQKVEVMLACKKHIYNNTGFHKFSFHTFMDITEKDSCSKFCVIL